MAALIRKPCPRCEGSGNIEKYFPDMFPPETYIVECPRCFGTGFDELREGFEEMGVEEE